MIKFSKSDINYDISKDYKLNSKNFRLKSEGTNDYSFQNKKYSDLKSFEYQKSKDNNIINHLSIPIFSKALNELNPRLSISKESFMSLIKYSLYHMSRGELEQIFLNIDIERKNKISQRDFVNFRNLFILPYEACDTNNDYLLDKSELERCFKKDPKYPFLDFRRRHKYDLYDKILNIISNRGDLKINFFSYLFFKKSLFAWTKCQTSRKYISVSGFKCAISIMTRLNRKSIAVELYKIALQYQFNDMALIAADFICYLNIAYKYFQFNIIIYPNKDEVLEKNVFLKAIEEDRIPMNFSIEEINTFYDLIGKGI